MFESFRNSSAKAQALMVLLVAIVISIVLTVVWYFAFYVSYEPVFMHLARGDAAAITNELDKRKIPYRLGDGGTTVAIPEDKADAVRVSFAGNDLAFKGEAGFELFDKSDMGITDFAQKINFQRALQGELERTIAALDGVEIARVHLSMGDDRLFRQDRAPPKASVTLRMRNAAPVEMSTVAGVQQLVSAAVPLLEPSSVVVLDEAGHILSSVANPSSPGSELSPQAAEKRAVEGYYEARARAALDGVFGPGYVQVAITAEPAWNVATNSPQFDLKNRKFGLRVSLRPRNPITGKSLQGARDLVSQAIGLNQSLGDTILFDDQQAASVAVLPPAPVLAAAPGNKLTEISDKPDRTMPYIAAGGVGFLAICLALIVAVLRRSHAAPLDEDQRVTFAERLKSLLDEDAIDDPAKA